MEKYQILIPHRLTEKTLCMLAVDVCRFVRTEYGLMNFEDAPYEQYEDFILACIQDSGIAEALDDDERIEDFELLCADLWPESSSENLFKLESAIRRFEENEFACADPRFRNKSIQRAATFLECLAEAHGGGDSVFYMSCRKLGEILGYSKDKAYRLLGILRETYQFVEVVKKYSLKSRKAWEYRLTLKNETHNTELSTQDRNPIPTLKDSIPKPHFNLPEDNTGGKVAGRKEEPGSVPEMPSESAENYDDIMDRVYEELENERKANSR